MVLVFRLNFTKPVILLIFQVYAVCHSFKSLINLIELLELVTGKVFWGEKMNILVAISHFCITLNSSINFAIYCSKEKSHLNKPLNVFLNSFVFPSYQSCFHTLYNNNEKIDLRYLIQTANAIFLFLGNICFSLI